MTLPIEEYKECKSATSLWGFLHQHRNGKYKIIINAVKYKYPVIYVRKVS
jgi:hypothetical protein